MKHGGKMLVCLAGGFAACVAAHAVTPEPPTGPYQSIIDRNLFALKPPPPPPDPEATKAPPVKITLTGITTILGNKRALMKSPAPPGKPGEPAKPELSYILTVGQREGDVEVLDIDEVAGNVKLRNAGVEVTLNIDKDGPKLAPSASGVPGIPGVPGAPLPAPGARVLTPPSPTGNPGFTMPTRSLRLPPAGAASSAGNTGGAPFPGQTAGVAPAISPGYVGSAPQNLSGQAQRNWPPEANLTREEQAIAMEAEKQILMQQGNRAAFLIPSTGLSDSSSSPQTGGSGTQSPGLPRPPGSPPLPQ